MSSGRTLLFLLGLPLALGGQPFSQTVEWSAGQVEEARANLAAERARVAAEKKPLLEALTALQAERREWQRENSRLAARTAGTRSTLEQKEAEADDFLRESGFNSGRLLQFRRLFEEKLHIAERAEYEPALLAFEKATGSEEDAELAELAQRLDLVERALSRLRDQVGGRRYPAEATVGGLVQPGEVGQAGPYAFFAAGSGPAGSLQLGPGLRPELHDLGKKEAAAVRLLTAGEAAVLPLDPTLDQALIIAASRPSLGEHIFQGGMWMIPIFAFGGVSALLAVWKWLQVRRIRLPRAHELEALVAATRPEAPPAALEGALGLLHSSLRPVFAAGHAFRQASDAAREAAMHHAFIDFRTALESRLSLISLTAAVAPLLGLLGTVTGMIKTFQLISIYGAGDAKALSSGISEALITTEYGLIVAIPALLLHAFLNRRVRRILVQTMALIDRFNQSLAAPGSLP